jgi:hypothetical protein
MLEDTESRATFLFQKKAVAYFMVWFGWPLGVRFDVDDRDIETGHGYA